MLVNSKIVSVGFILGMGEKGNSAMSQALSE